MSADLILGLVQALLAFLIALVGLLVEYHRREGKRQRSELEGKMEAILEQLELSVGDLRRQQPKGR